MYMVLYYFYTGLFTFLSNSMAKFAYSFSVVLCSHCIIGKLSKGVVGRRFK